MLKLHTFHSDASDCFAYAIASSKEEAINMICSRVHRLGSIHFRSRQDTKNMLEQMKHKAESLSNLVANLIELN